MIRFKEVPKINPRTDKETVLFACSVCGSIVVNRNIHNIWHQKTDNTIPYWEGIDNMDEGK